MALQSAKNPARIMTALLRGMCRRSGWIPRNMCRRNLSLPTRPHFGNTKTSGRCWVEAGDVVTPEEASRRVLRPAKPGACPVFREPPAQPLCLPAADPARRAGVRAPSYSIGPCGWCSKGKGAITTVNGGRVRMMRGDFIITPSWVWHGHTKTAIRR